MALGKLIERDAFVIAADTVVAAGVRILPKAETPEQAATCIKILSGRRHDVFTCVAIRAPDGRITSRTVKSIVGFARLDEGQKRAYLESQDWQGKAGGYAIQGLAAEFIDFLSGSYSAVVGLPLYETGALLRGLGYR
jgi:septum formation protein